MERGRVSFEALKHKAIPVLRGSSADAVLSLAHVLLEEGFTTLEVTFTVPNAERVIRELSRLEGVLIGAGTVLNAGDFERAVASGAGFVVSPGLTLLLSGAARVSDVPFLPGVLTPSEVMRALELGFEHLKLFPGELGGVAHLKSLRAPFPGVAFMPTGGVNVDNLEPWVSAGAFAVGIGSSLVGDGQAEGVRGRARALRSALEGLGWAT
jgi:2-dehydro-3-deoxyphosphogluconate aldolase/(4S)-4-hydroxy-2-oxoglutarate aldolase